MPVSRRNSRRATAALILAAVVLAAGGALWWLTRTVAVAAPVEAVQYRVIRPTLVTVPEATPRTLDPYVGLGAWVDGFDYSPPYSSTGEPPLPPSELDAMAGAGVRTVYLQSGRLDDRSPDTLEDRWVLTEFLLRARQNDMAVIAWFLPKWGDDGQDLAHLQAAADFEALGLRFDGVAVDIEWNQGGLEPDERSRRFVALSEAFRASVGPDEPIGAIVLPPVQTEVVNPTFWTGFPWQEVADLYDVWLPMSYWSFRTDPWDDAYAYNAESVIRLRANIGDPDALVHAIGGIGGQADAPPPGTEPFLANTDQLEGFARSLADTGAIGGSIYDWLTLDESGKAELARLFSTGVASDLPSLGG